MPISWNEIKNRAVAFSKEWENTEREEADAKEFLIEFLNVFGITKRRVATFEHKVKKLSAADGYIDLLWSGMLLVEMKSKGKDLDKAYHQAKEYCHGLKEHELPKLIMVCDFHDFVVYNEEGEKTSFTLPELIQQIQLFAPLAGYQKRIYKEQDPVNIQAAERMGKLHDKLKAIGYDGHSLELYLVRLLFCLFADDTGIFDKSIFQQWIEEKTKEDGSDLAANIAQFFQILNTPDDKRLRVLDEALAAFPYINGKLFEENLPVAAFDSQMRTLLLDCCALDWGKISPAIFGSLFQSVMDEKARRNLGAHYTSEKNILKLIKPLFLDELYTEYNTAKNDKRKLQKLHEKISRLRFLDPACGCGNFLIIAYRELRLLELEIVSQLLKGQQVTSINDYFLIDVDQFYGIEYEEFPSQIAPVAMWLMDHQLNGLASLQFGEYYKRIPLKKSATIVHGNALRIDWQSLINPMPWEKYSTRYHYILGNPPFLGKTWQNESQRKDIETIFSGVHSAGLLDYVSCWYIKAAQYMEINSLTDDKDLPKTHAAFVSTNSITQGEQVGILWNELVNRYKVKINFAHRTFSWSNEAKGNAAVHVVIIGFACVDDTEKSIFEYTEMKGEPHEIKVSKINPYLVEGNNILLKRRTEPICNVPKIGKGNQPTDGGFLLLSKEEKAELIAKEPQVIPYIKKFLGGQEFIQGIERFCLWLVDINPSVLRKMPKVLVRLDGVRKMREISTDPKTREMARTPWLFRETDNFDSFVAIPEVSSERRHYIPIGFLDKETIPSNKLQILPNGTLWHFGVLTSSIHMAWIKYTCGRMKSDFQYSAGIVYNNFPWPENPTDKQKQAVETAAQAVLDVRKQFMEPVEAAQGLPTFERLATLSEDLTDAERLATLSEEPASVEQAAAPKKGASLADLYDPNTMPPALVKAHQQLDKAVDNCYRPQPFTSEAKRIEYLFELYDKYTAGLFVQEKAKKKKIASK